MTDAHKQKVTIIVTDGDKTATFENERSQDWPGAKPQNIFHLIDATAGLAKSAISSSSEKDSGSHTHQPGYRGAR